MVEVKNDLAKLRSIQRLYNINHRYHTYTPVFNKGLCYCDRSKNKKILVRSPVSR